MTLEPLVHEAIQQGAAVVTEGGAGVRVGAELVLSGLATPALLPQQVRVKSLMIQEQYAFTLS